jgi:hypothetical protein
MEDAPYDDNCVPNFDEEGAVIEEVLLETFGRINRFELLLIDVELGNIKHVKV